MLIPVGVVVPMVMVWAPTCKVVAVVALPTRFAVARMVASTYETVF